MMRFGSAITRNNIFPAVTSISTLGTLGNFRPASSKPFAPLAARLYFSGPSDTTKRLVFCSPSQHQTVDPVIAKFDPAKDGPKFKAFVQEFGEHAPAECRRLISGCEGYYMTRSSSSPHYYDDESEPGEPIKSQHGDPWVPATQYGGLLVHATDKDGKMIGLCSAEHPCVLDEMSPPSALWNYERDDHVRAVTVMVGSPEKQNTENEAKIKRQLIEAQVAALGDQHEALLVPYEAGKDEELSSLLAGFDGVAMHTEIYNEDIGKPYSVLWARIPRQTAEPV